MTTFWNYVAKARALIAKYPLIAVAVAFVAGLIL